MVEPKSVLNPQATHYVEMVDSLALEHLKTRYTFIGVEDFQKLLSRDVSEGMRVYWIALVRSHDEARQSYNVA